MRATRLIGELTKDGLLIMFKPGTLQIDQNQISKT